MILFKQPDALSGYLAEQKEKGKTIGFVPTMGALHEGHLVLLKTARAETDLTVVSIFVNPTQFNDPADFKKYPVTIEKDIDLLLRQQADLLFIPDQRAIYPTGTSHPKHYELGKLESILEGQFRPGHFQGVCQVMDRLLRIVTPHQLFMGRKDYQQCMVIDALIRLENLATNLHVVDTIREDDGLAMSSRNLRLNMTERETAVTIYKALQFVKENMRPGLQEEVLATAREMLIKKGFRIDYLQLADAKTLGLLAHWDGHQKAVLLVAAYLNEIRLIDNMLAP